jgi:P27 family predicted phage terminase small subunit
LGQRGPRPKPAAAHQRAGTYRKDRHAGGPKVGSGRVPKKPAGMSAAAGKEFDRLAKNLAAEDLLSDRFVTIFSLYCEEVAAYWRHHKRVAKDGDVIETKSGNLIQHPSVGMKGKCLDRIVRMSREIGLTPSAATGLELTPGVDEGTEEEDPLGEMQNGGRPSLKVTSAG